MRAPVPVPCRFPGACIVVVGTGPSLRADDLTPYAHCPIIVINDAYRLVPWADVLYAPDQRWWRWHPDAATYPGDKYTLDPGVVTDHPDVGLLDFRSGTGLASRPDQIVTGGHSGYAAITLAVHYGPAEIILLGYDLAPDPAGQHHFFGEHPDGSHVRYDQWREAYSTLVAPLAQRGIRIVNASRRSTITAIPRLHDPYE